MIPYISSCTFRFSAYPWRPDETEGHSFVCEALHLPQTFHYWVQCVCSSEWRSGRPACQSSRNSTGPTRRHQDPGSRLPAVGRTELPAPAPSRQPGSGPPPACVWLPPHLHHCCREKKRMLSLGNWCRCECCTFLEIRRDMQNQAQTSSFSFSLFEPAHIPSGKWTTKWVQN